MGAVNISNPTNPTDSSIELLVIFNVGDNPGGYYVYITCDQTGETSPDLGYSYNSTYPHWSISHTFTGLNSGTFYSFTAEVRAVGSPSPTYLYRSYNTTGTALPPRPNNFYWTTSKVSGWDFELYDFEWNDLTGRINEFRVYQGDSETGFTTAYSGNNFTAIMFNEAALAILFLGASPPSSKSSGDLVYASDLNQLVNALNSVS